MRTLSRALIVALLVLAPSVAMISPAHALGVIYSENFNDRIAQGWTLEDPWAIRIACHDSYHLSYQRNQGCDSAYPFPPANATFSVDLTGARHPQLRYLQHHDTYLYVCIPEDPTCPPKYTYLDSAISARRPGGAWQNLSGDDGCYWNFDFETCRMDLDPFADGPVEIRFFAHIFSDHSADGSGYYVDDIVIEDLAPTVRAHAGADRTWTDGDNSSDALVTLDGSLSEATLGISSYAWTLDGATIASTQTAQVLLPVGFHNVMLTITDAAGSTHADGVRHTVRANQAPRANAGADQIRRTMGQGATAALSGSATDADGSIVGYSWYEGPTLLASAASANLTLPLGEHVLRLEARDNGGAIGSDEVLVSVRANLPPVPAAKIDCYGRKCRFDASPSTDPDGPIATYHWTADGTTTTGASRTEAYPAYDRYIVTLDVVDDLGAMSTAAFEADALPEPVPPVPTIVPLLAQVRDNVENDGDLLGGEQDLDAIWFDATDTTLYVGMHAASTQGIPLVTVEHIASFRPSWTDGVASWGVGIPIGATVESIEVVALLRDGAPPEYVLRLLLDSGTRVQLAQLVGETSSATGIHWISVPRLLLREAPGGILGEPELLVRDVAPALATLIVDHSEIGAHYPMPGIDGVNRVTHAFDLGDEGFVKLADESFADVAWDSGAGRVGIVAARDDPNDEILAQGLPGRYTDASPSFRASAKFRATTPGAHQHVWPLALVPAGTADVAAAPSALGCDYTRGATEASFGAFLRGAGLNRVASRSHTPDAIVTCEVAWDATSRQLSARVLDGAYEIIGTSRSLASSEHFDVELVAIATDGMGGEFETETVAWVDDIVVSWSRV